eukprot:GSA25T00025913001.1
MSFTVLRQRLVGKKSGAAHKHCCTTKNSRTRTTTVKTLVRHIKTSHKEVAANYKLFGSSLGVVVGPPSAFRATRTGDKKNRTSSSATKEQDFEYPPVSLLVKYVHPRSIFRKHLRKGDAILAVNGEPLSWRCLPPDQIMLKNSTGRGDFVTPRRFERVLMDDVDVAGAAGKKGREEDQAEGAITDAAAGGNNMKEEQQRTTSTTNNKLDTIKEDSEELEGSRVDDREIDGQSDKEDKKEDEREGEEYKDKKTTSSPTTATSKKTWSTLQQRADLLAEDFTAMISLMMKKRYHWTPTELFEQLRGKEDDPERDGERGAGREDGEASCTSSSAIGEDDDVDTDDLLDDDDSEEEEDSKDAAEGDGEQEEVMTQTVDDKDNDEENKEDRRDQDVEMVEESSCSTSRRPSRSKGTKKGRVVSFEEDVKMEEEKKTSAGDDVFSSFFANRNGVNDDLELKVVNKNCKKKQGKTSNSTSSLEGRRRAGQGGRAAVGRKAIGEDDDEDDSTPRKSDRRNSTTSHSTTPVAARDRNRDKPSRSNNSFQNKGAALLSGGEEQTSDHDK